VEADFAKTREDYRHLMQTDVDAINKRDAFVTDMRGIDKVGALGWDAAKARLDKEWTDLKAAADKAS
jgi:hypothetical protein